MIASHRRELVAANLIAVLGALAAVPVPLLIPLLVDEVLLEKPGAAVGWMNRPVPRSLAWPGAVHLRRPGADDGAASVDPDLQRLADARVHDDRQGRDLQHPPHAAAAPRALLDGRVRDPRQQYRCLAPGHRSRRDRPVRQPDHQQVHRRGAQRDRHRDRAAVDALAARAVHPAAEPGGDLPDDDLRAPRKAPQGA